MQGLPVKGLIAAGNTGDWSFGGSILTFAFPMILFIAVASALYVLYTKPHLVPGHRYRLDGRATVQTPAVVPPAPPAGTAAQTATGGGQATGRDTAQGTVRDTAQDTGQDS